MARKHVFVGNWGIRRVRYFFAQAKNMDGVGQLVQSLVLPVSYPAVNSRYTFLSLGLFSHGLALNLCLFLIEKPSFLWACRSMPKNHLSLKCDLLSGEATLSIYLHFDTFTSTKKLHKLFAGLQANDWKRHISHTSSSPARLWLLERPKCHTKARRKPSLVASLLAISETEEVDGRSVHLGIFQLFGGRNLALIFVASLRNKYIELPNL